MKARVFHLDTDEHRAVEALLPWYVNGTLPQEELELVRGHLAQCARCQADAAWQDGLRLARPAMEPVPNAEVDRHWAALSGRLASPETPSPRWSTPLGDWLRARWLPLALVAQGALLIAVLVTTWLAAPQREESYYALGAAPTAVLRVESLEGAAP